MGTLKKHLGLQDPPPVPPISVPGPTKEEQELVKLQLRYLNEQMTITPEEQAMMDKEQQYFEEMMAKDILSPQEEAEFEREYSLQLEALQEQFGLETEQYGAKQMADLVSRGVLGTTTGETSIAQSQQQFANVLAGQVSELGQAKELAKSDVEAAKREMAQQGYRLTSGLFQSQATSTLQAASNLQNYYGGREQLQAQTQLQNALAQQMREQAGYQSRMRFWGGVAGLGTGLMKAGATG